ncbi:hypothetical protein K6U06_20285 [Acidiferrimicrobium sp. IK]|uniref:ABC transporter permease subunit n=1 Tax=Acidiferrimicrobium sp. IK TaxID=2871700 RepID=UPI0021CB87F9|nr:hypothetical protein [Acidiferrimicrobium sp. IK]MCU4186714.1 hypothetical protein [Acidiferrimicrobium sp. IK]
MITTPSTPSATAPDPGATGGGGSRPGLARLRGRVFSSSSPAWIFLVLVVIVAVFSVIKPHQFLSSFDIKSIFINASVDLVMAVGMTFVIVTAGIDLSVGSVLVFSGVVAVKVMEALASGATAVSAGWGVILVGLLAGMAAGAAWGVAQGAVIAKAKVPPFIVTLGGFGAALGLSQVLTNGVDASDVPAKLGNTIGNGSLGPFPWLVIIALVVAVIGAGVLQSTRFGRYTFAIGSNAEGARRTGINVDRHLLKVYAVVGLLSGLAGDLSLAHFTTTTLASHNNDNLTVITAVILGGTSLFGGVGSMFGTVVGVLIPVVLDAGLVIVGVQTFWQGVAVGVVLVLAVYADQLRRKNNSRR